MPTRCSRPSLVTRRHRRVWSLRLPPDVHGLNVYGRDGRLVLSSTRPDRVGRRRTSPDLRAAIETGQPERRDRRPDGRGAARREGLGTAPLVPRTCPWERPRSRSTTPPSPGSSTTPGRPSGTPSGSSSGSSGSSSRCSSAAPLPGCVLRTRISQQRSHDLVESSRELEATLLETIETLNAAVEARDPYTAGHSQRVRRVSLAIGRELRLPAKQLGALATAALFHDIGKIGMPGRDPHQAGPARPRGGDDHARARHPGSGDRRADHLAQRLRPGDPPPPRALGRPRLPGWAERYRHPGRRSDHRDRRRLGRDDDRSPLRGRARHGRGDAPDPGRTREAVQPGGRRRVLDGVAPSARGDPPARRRRRPQSSRSEPRSETRDRCRPSRP